MRYQVALLLSLCACTAISGQTQREFRRGTYLGREITYEVQGQYAIVQGDIILGTVEEISSGKRAASRSSIADSNTADRWPNGTIPYVINDDVPNQQRVRAAADYWNTHTPLKIVPRTNETNYVRFVRAQFDAACASAIGMRGGEQAVQLTDGCTSMNLVHELGHAFGLYHEQERQDRNANLTVLYQNIDKRYYHDFDQLFSGATDGGYYDFDSIMHYGPTGFSNNGQDTLETVPIGIQIGQRDHLSPGDIDNVVRLYGITPSDTTITTAPQGLKIVVDGTEATSPQTYSWAPGSSHTIAVAPFQGRDPRYAFANWSDGGSSAHEVTASPDHTVFCANFARQHLLSTGATAGGSVNIIPGSLDGYYNERSQILLNASADDGLQFLRWTGTTNLTSNGYGLSVPNPKLDVALVNGNFVGAFTGEHTTTISSDPPGRPVTIDGLLYLTPVRFAWASGSSHDISLAATQLDGNNTVRYTFQGWNDSQDATRTIKAGDDNTVYTASFKTQYLVSTSIAGPIRGAKVVLTPSSDDGFYDAGAILDVEAQPPAGSSFVYWLGDLAGGSPKAQLTVSEQRSIVGYFNTSAIAFRVLNGASYLGNPLFTNTGSIVSPGEIVTLFGTKLGPETLTSAQLDANGRIATKLAGMRILFDGVPAPILYVSANQASVIVPYAVGKSSSTLVAVENQGVITGRSSISVGDAVPAFFTADSSGKGQLAALNQNGSVNSSANPAARGSVLVLYATGEGSVTPAVADGQFNSTTLPKPNGAVSVRLGRVPARVLYAGAAPGQVAGLMQINILVPDEVIPDLATPIQLNIGTFSSPPGTTVAIQ